MKSKTIQRKIEVIGFIEYYLTNFCESIEGLELSEKGEMVTVIYDGGARQEVCIECDSNLAILKDIATAIKL